MVRHVVACLVAVFLTGIVMPDSPAPRRHARSPLTAAKEKLEAGAAEAEKEAATRQPSTQGKSYLRTPDRSARQIAPSKRLK